MNWMLPYHEHKHVFGEELKKNYKEFNNNFCFIPKYPNYSNRTSTIYNNTLDHISF